MTAFTSDKNGNLIEIATRNSVGWEYRYESPIGDTEPSGLPVEEWTPDNDNQPVSFRRTTGTFATPYQEPTGLQAAARLQSDLNTKIANLVLAATTAAGHITILNEIASQWVRGDTARFPLYAALDARDELLKAIQELAR